MHLRCVGRVSRDARRTSGNATNWAFLAWCWHILLMQNVEHENAPRGLLTGEIAFASPEAQVQRTAELLGSGALVVDVPPLALQMRGRLAEHLDEHVERALAARGAPA